MRVSCLQENLAKGLSIVGRTVSSRSTLPVLGNILIQAKNNQLRLAATNLELGVSCWIGAKVEDEGEITVPARLLTDFVNSLPPERIDMELTVRTQTLHLHCDRFDANMKGLDANEFPILLSTEPGDDASESAQLLEGMQLELETGGLRKMIDQVIFAASTDDSRPTLTGVEVNFSAERLSMAATDGFRLSLRTVPLDDLPIGEPLTVVVPARSLNELARVTADAHDERLVRVVVAQARNQILFEVWGKPEGRGVFHRVELVSQLIDARFPDYRAIIPKTHTTRTVVDTAALLKAVRVASLFTRESHIIRFAVEPGAGSDSGQLRLTATSPEIGDSVNEIDAMVDGEELEIAFNARFLIDVLSQIDQPQVVLETTQPTRPGAIRPVGLGEDEFLHVVMPMLPQQGGA
ncbi:MAG: DNA polymerase III subunit beta [Caldilineaceae bacterium]|nr:DNA polymerase III subunit beta [Caldilineaceae bacterium]